MSDTCPDCGAEVDEKIWEPHSKLSCCENQLAQSQARVKELEGMITATFHLHDEGKEFDVISHSLEMSPEVRRIILEVLWAKAAKENEDE